MQIRFIGAPATLLPLDSGKGGCMTVDYKQLYKEFLDSFLVKDQGTFLTVAPPVYFGGSFDSIAIRVERIEQGVILGDCHCVEDYWENFYDESEIDVEKVQKICDRFGLYQEERVFCMKILTDCEERIYRGIGNFLQAIILLCNAFN